MLWVLIAALLWRAVSEKPRMLKRSYGELFQRHHGCFVECFFGAPSSCFFCWKTYNIWSSAPRSTDQVIFIVIVQQQTIQILLFANKIFIARFWKSRNVFLVVRNNKNDGTLLYSAQFIVRCYKTPNLCPGIMKTSFYGPVIEAHKLFSAV